MQYLKRYSNFETVEQMDFNVQQHIEHSFKKLKSSTRKVLYAIAGRALQFAGAAHLKVETIAKDAKVSEKTVTRAISDLVDFKIVNKINCTKMNGIKGANIYSILPFVPSNVPSKMSEREKTETPCETKFEAPKKIAQSFNSLITNKSFKDTNATNVPDKNESLKIGLLSKVPQALAKAISPFMDDVNEIHEMVGTIFNAKSKVSKTIKIEAYENEFYKAIVSVFESQKRAARKEKAFNIFAVMYKAIENLTKQIVNPVQEKAPLESPKPLQTKEYIQQWMIDGESDPIRKAQLQATKELQEQQNLLNRSKEVVPDWMRKQSAIIPDAPKNNSTNNDAEFFEIAQRQFRERLMSI